MDRPAPPLGHLAQLPAIERAQSVPRQCEVRNATRDILDFWFQEMGPHRWWTRSDETDAEIRNRFLALWDKWRTRAPECFLDTARDALAAVVLFDQFSRNMFRGLARAFAADPLALEIARRTIERGLDQALTREERIFLYMPFMHSEDLPMQDRAVALFETGLPTRWYIPRDDVIGERAFRGLAGQRSANLQ